MANLFAALMMERWANILREVTSMAANDRQEGGSHYKGTGEEHWDRVWRLGMNYWQAAATKYIERYQKKNGEEDLRKAIHYIEKLIELEYPKNPSEQEVAGTELEDLRAMRSEYLWVRGSLAQFMGYDGPLTPAGCPLEDWLSELLTLRSTKLQGLSGSDTCWHRMDEDTHCTLPKNHIGPHSFTEREEPTRSYVDQDKAPYPGVKPLHQVVDKATVAETWQVLSWRYFTYEGGNVIHDFFRCKQCRTHMTVPRGANPHARHSCAVEKSASI